MHVPTSRQCRLYETPWLCGSAYAAHEWVRAFTDYSFSTCRPLRLRETGGCKYPVPSPPTLAFAPSLRARLYQRSHKSASRGGIVSELHYGSLSLRPVDLLALLTDLTEFSLSH